MSGRTNSTISAFCAALLIGLSACGSDSTAPATVDAQGALRSLAIGLRELSDDGTLGELNESFGGIAPLLDRVTVNVGGKDQTMFGLGLRESFPPGTCDEQIFPEPFPPLDPAVCTPLSLSVLLLFWQSRSAEARPDRMIFISTDVGTTDFAFDLSTEALTGVALYVDGQKVWFSTSGTLATGVTASTPTCDLPLPPFATGGTCNFASFDEQGALTMEDFTSVNGSPATTTITIPGQTFDGVWQSITGVKPLTLIANGRRMPSLHITSAFRDP